MAEVPRYRGEIAPRGRLTGLALTLLMPGLGHVYVGSFAGGLLRYLVLFGGVLTFLLSWRVFRFQPHLPLLVLAASTVIYMTALLQDVWRRTGPAGRDYVLQGFNHPVIYGALLLCCHVGPLLLLLERTSGTVITTTEVTDGGMFPMLFIGDRVLVDRTAFRRHPPKPGDLAVLRDPQSLRPLIRRVVAGPSSTISFEGRVPVVDHRPLLQEPLGRLSLSGTDNRGLPAGMHLHGFAEENGEARYTVTHRPDQHHEDTEAVRLPEEGWWVLADNRDEGRDSRAFGAVPRDVFLGRPLWVWWSRDPEVAHTAWNRLGLAAR